MIEKLEVVSYRRDSTWGHPQPEVILPSLIPLVFERFFAYFNFVVVPKQSPYG